MVPTGKDREESVRQVLELARGHLGMDVAWVSRFTSGGQVFEQVVEVEPGMGPATNSEEPLEGSYCLRVLDGRLPSVVPDSRRDPRTRDLHVTEDLGIGSYVGVPIRSAQGEVRGMLCCMGGAANTTVSEEDLTFLDGLAGLVANLDAMGETDPAREAELQATWWRVKSAVAGRGLQMALQPVVDLSTGGLYGAEALARFEEPPSAPDLWFADASRLGLRTELEVATARAALRRMGDLPPGAVLSVNASPELITSGALKGLLAHQDLSRIALEVTEHAAVKDYAALVETLAPYRDAGMLLSIDDAGAGYASFRHIVQLHPDSIKIDLSLIRDIDRDPVCQSLVTSLVAFAKTTNVLLIAEGVETQAELDMLTTLGVRYAQGYLLARPSTDLPATDFTRFSPPEVVTELAPTTPAPPRDPTATQRMRAVTA